MVRCTYFFDTYIIRRVCILYLKEIHGTNHGLHRHEDVLIDELNESSLVFIRVPGSMNDSHLFDKRGLPRLSRA